MRLRKALAPQVRRAGVSDFGEDVGDVGLVERLEGVLSDSGMECPGAEAF